MKKFFYVYDEGHVHKVLEFIKLFQSPSEVDFGIAKMTNKYFFVCPTITTPQDVGHCGVGK